MRIEQIRVRDFKRFTDLTVTGLPESAKLVVLIGPNGSGKSSLFDAFNIWRRSRSFGAGHNDGRPYYAKVGHGVPDDLRAMGNVEISFHSVDQSVFDTDRERARATFSIRSAYRNEADFVLDGMYDSVPVMDREGPRRLIDNDVSVSQNYKHLISSTLAGLYSGSFDNLNGREIVDHLVQRIREPLLHVFSDLRLLGPGEPMRDGTFLFEKGTSRDFDYKNLSGGEKAAFDMLLDLVIRTQVLKETIYCIDEPEVHLNSRVQGPLLREMVDLLPDNSQLWIATHSIGMMRAARDLQENTLGGVVFLDFFDKDFDHPAVLQPVSVDRELWRKVLDVAFGDLADLLAPKQVVLCEGRPANESRSGKAELDAQCYRQIFASSLPDVEFVSVGNEHAVRRDEVKLGNAIQTLVSGTSLIRLVDRDDRSDSEIEDLKAQGFRVLSQRNLESYLFSDEILTKLATTVGKQELVPRVKELKARAIDSSVARGNSVDDLKSAAGEIYTGLKNLLSLRQCGNTVDAFKRDTLAPLVTSETDTYRNLNHDIFSEETSSPERTRDIRPSLCSVSEAAYAAGDK